MNPNELQDRIQRLLDDELPADEFAALEAELLENPEALETYRTWVGLHCGLQSRGAVRAAVEKLPVVPVDRVIALQRRRVAKISLLAAAAVLLISAVALWLNMVPDHPATLAGFRTAPNSAFILSHAGDGESPMGNVLAEGSRVALDHGVVELELPHQVRAVIEAPASMLLLDEKTLQLDHGRAFFHLPSEDGHGFTVVTPQQRIVDLGTAFGIDARKGRDTVELHLFEGRVRLDSPDGTEGKTITAPRSVLLAGARVQRDLDGPPAAFLRKLPPKVEYLLREDFESGLVGGRDYAVQIDPNAITDLAGNRFRGIDDDESWNFSTAPPATVPCPVASYVYDGENPPTDQPSDHQPGSFPAGLFSDPGNTKLTDGNPGDPAGWRSGSYVGFKDDADVSNPQVTFDLGAAHDVQSITATLHTMTSDLPESVKVSVSTDGMGFSTPVNLVPHCSGSGLVTATLDVSTFGPARYVRLNFVNPTQWAFLGEVQFASASAPSRGDGPGDLAADEPAPEIGPGLTERDDSPPQLIALHPADDATNTATHGRLAMVFDEPVRLGTGRFFFRSIDDWSENTLTVGDPRLSVDGRVLTITPPVGLADGERRPGEISGWESDPNFAFLNPRGDGTCYADDNLRDKGPARGTIGSMSGPLIATLSPGRPDTGIRHELGPIAPDSRYTVSAAIGVRDEQAKAAFLGYTIRLSSGATVLAELTDDTPPGPPNSVTTVGFSWDSSSLPEGVVPGAPLAIEIAPNQAAGDTPGYLDLDNVRVSVLGN